MMCNPRVLDSGPILPRKRPLRASTYATLVIWSLLPCCKSTSSLDTDSGQLLQLHGSLELPSGRAAGRPIAALLYADGHSHLQLQELALQGSFPTDIQVELRKPPPEGALYNIGELDEPRVASGFLTMIPESHPDSMRFTTVTTRDVSCQGACEITERWCADDFECYSEVRICPDASPSPSCTLHTEGDEALKQPPPWDLFAGVSEDYVLVYASASLPAGSVTATLFGSPMGMSQGYHVLEARRLADSELAAQHACWNAAVEDAVEQLNAEELSDYTSLDLLRPCADENSWLVNDGPLCGQPLAEREALRARFETASWRARLERSCALSVRMLRPADLKAPLSIHLFEATGANSIALF
jgi:hypothetical protein